MEKSHFAKNRQELLEKDTLEIKSEDLGLCGRSCKDVSRNVYEEVSHSEDRFKNSSTYEISQTLAYPRPASFQINYSRVLSTSPSWRRWACLININFPQNLARPVMNTDKAIKRIQGVKATSDSKHQRDGYINGSTQNMIITGPFRESRPAGYPSTRVYLGDYLELYRLSILDFHNRLVGECGAESILEYSCLSTQIAFFHRKTTPADSRRRKWTPSLCSERLRDVGLSKYSRRRKLYF